MYKEASAPPWVTESLSILTKKKPLCVFLRSFLVLFFLLTFSPCQTALARRGANIQLPGCVPPLGILGGGAGEGGAGGGAEDQGLGGRGEVSGQSAGGWGRGAG